MVVPGDYLQLIYHLWLAQDTFFGPTRWFTNPYEFNTGDEKERVSFSMRYYLPFSLVFAIVGLTGNMALAMNIVGFVTIWVTLFFTWLLVRRQTTSAPLAMLAAAVSVMIPYRWYALFAGSPTGLAMMWVPIAFYGLDVMLHDRKMWGSILAGASIFLAGWSDPHVVFFAGLAAPCWCLLTWISRKGLSLASGKELSQLTKLAIPLFCFAVLVALEAFAMSKDLTEKAVANAQRPIHEVAGNSPHATGIISPRTDGIDAQVYLGLFLILLMSMATVSTLAEWLKKRDTESSRRAITCGLLYLGLFAVIMLSLGTNGPERTRGWIWLTRLLPPYARIRQPAKIFILVPTLAASLLAMTLPVLFNTLKLRRRHVVPCILIGVALMMDCGFFIHPGISRLEKEQGAYAAIRKDADSRSIDPHMLALPLWPGNSHWTSLNQYYVSRYRIRMVNGYRPTVRQHYLDDIYLRFESFNAGGFENDQLDNLLGRGIDYIVLHENAFPEKVSPFPVWHTLHALLVNPRLRLLKQDGPAWAFRIEEKASSETPNIPDSPYHFPARLWQADSSAFTNAVVRESENTSGNRYLSLSGKNSQVTTHSYPMPYVTNLCYLVRTRGAGQVISTIMIDRQATTEHTTIPGSEAWTWTAVPIQAYTGYRTLQLRLTAHELPADIDLVILTTSEWDPNSFEHPRVIPATSCFHAGYTDLAGDQVVIRPDYDPASVVFYAPKLPVPAGAYDITLYLKTDAPDGTVLGELRSRYPHGKIPVTPVVAGKPARLTYTQDCNLRMALDFEYSRSTEVRLKSIIIAPHG